MMVRLDHLRLSELNIIGANVKKFPNDFVWGTATSSYQIEGASQAGGRGESIWDAFTHIPGKVVNNDHGDVACDHFHKFKEDIQFMADMGLQAYRFSVAWPRIQPDGKGKPNSDGIRFYSELIDTLLAHNITPWVTLYHWDLPLSLQLCHDGWMNPQIAEDFAKYASICFNAFGDRVSNWLTLNEPWCSAVLGHGLGVHAPGRVSPDEPYIVGHNLLRAHALAVHEYRSRFQSRQKGQIALSNNCDWREPLTDSPEDQAAAQRALEFFLGWFADPVYKGDYPEVMRERLGDRLPQFTEEERAMLLGSADYFGLNHYTTMYAANGQHSNGEVSAFGNGGMSEDQDVWLSADPEWRQTDMKWNIVPWGFRKLLHWIDDRYNSPDIYVMENGCAFNDQPQNGRVADKRRIEFVQSYLSAAHEAIEANVKLKGYFLWSFMDNFEWALGYTKRFGIHHVDYRDGTRIPKDSAKWYRHVIEQNGVI